MRASSLALASVFFGGMTAGFAVLSLIQDSIGRDAYLEWISAHWLPAYVSVPMALSFLVTALTGTRVAARVLDDAQHRADTALARVSSAMRNLAATVASVIYSAPREPITHALDRLEQALIRANKDLQ